MPTQAVCFDLGGVVAHISTRWAEILTRLGLPVPANIGPDSDLSDMPEFDAYQADKLSAPEYIDRLSRYLAVSPKDAATVHSNILIGPYPGVLEIVRDLNRHGVMTGCLSNTNAPHWIELALNGRFPAVVEMQIKLASFEVRVYKPDAKAYELFAYVAGIAPASILLFDDSLKNCKAASALGWRTVHIDPLDNPAKQMRHELEKSGSL